ncbi:hypothetical protein [Risungbinella massiliensis]|uniref:hypothetical protein n=1 Tax=Risungbinella massiliensis TaxID=1329796 RepID=UPI0005CBBB47|nr:hypothetical protein [Risungbinella massiliensis]
MEKWFSSFSSWKDVAIKSLLINLFFFVWNLIRELLDIGSKLILLGFKDGSVIYSFLFTYFGVYIMAAIIYLMQRRKAESK